MRAAPQRTPPTSAKRAWPACGCGFSPTRPAPAATRSHSGPEIQRDLVAVDPRQARALSQRAGRRGGPVHTADRATAAPPRTAAMPTLLVRHPAVSGAGGGDLVYPDG